MRKILTHNQQKLLMDTFKHRSITTKLQKVYKSTQRFYDATSYLQENGLMKTKLINHHTFEYSLTPKGEIVSLLLYSFKESHEDFKDIIARSSSESQKLFLTFTSDLLGINGG